MCQALCFRGSKRQGINILVTYYLVIKQLICPLLHFSIYLKFSLFPFSVILVPLGSEVHAELFQIGEIVVSSVLGKLLRMKEGLTRRKH